MYLKHELDQQNAFPVKEIAGCARVKLLHQNHHNRYTKEFRVCTLPVKIVYGVAPVVLNMPAEGGEAHPHIQPG